ncbi:MAG: sigma 54-interacting transcriptional regulator [Syntrophobacteraceae bacterium]|jgi:PAS domain S-box-containing protein|nr:sigma 54-interacting transcriptional regulator [Syntrophobacteraceae bacterium]
MFEEDLDRYWKTVVSTIRDGIMIIDTGGSIVSVNNALELITGYSRDELIGQKCSILNCSIFNMARENSGDHWCLLFKTGMLNLRRCTIMRKEGTYVHVLKNATPLHDGRGNVIGAVETVTDVTELVEKDRQLAAYRRELRHENSFQGLIGISARMQKVFDLIENAAGSDAPVIILGESGTGKELVARAIHHLGERKSGPYVKVNCACLTESLLESELFGHVKGAYTGAYKSREGRFEMARGGDIFLDEIGDLPLSTQVKLLRVLEEKVIERVGDNAPIAVDVRIISATNRDLAELVEQGSFRKDFYFRINVIPIVLPPLRERVEDIPLLAESFFRKTRLKGKKPIEGISRATMDLLLRYPWPGNVRELKSAFEYAFVTCPNRMIEPDHLPPDIQNFSRSDDDVETRPERLTRDEMHKERLLDALEQAKGNQSAAAAILGVSRVTVWNRMKRYGIRCTRKLDAKPR